MGVYHITYSPALKRVCLYFNGKCNFSCRGCINRYYPQDCHLDKDKAAQIETKTLSREEVISYLTPVLFDKVIFLGLEPTVDADFLVLARTMKDRFFAYNTLITNGYKYVEDRIIDEVCVSIKAVSPEIFKDFTGKDDPKRVLRNFREYTKCSWLKVRAESIFIPGYIDKEEIEKISSFIAEVDSLIPYRIDGYIPRSVYSPGIKDNFCRPTEKEMRKVKMAAEKYLKNVYILHHKVSVKHKVERIY